MLPTGLIRVLSLKGAGTRWTLHCWDGDVAALVQKRGMRIYSGLPSSTTMSSTISQVFVLPNGFHPDELKVGSLALSIPDLRQKARFYPRNLAFDVSTIEVDVADYELGQNQSRAVALSLGQLFFVNYARDTYAETSITAKLKIELLNDKEGISLSALDEQDVREWFNTQNSVRLFMVVETYTVADGSIWRNALRKKGMVTKATLPVSAIANASGVPCSSEITDPSAKISCGGNISSGTGHTMPRSPLVVAIQVAEIISKSKAGLFRHFGFRVRSGSAAEEAGETEEHKLEDVLVGEEDGELIRSADRSIELLIVQENMSSGQEA